MSSYHQILNDVKYPVSIQLFVCLLTLAFCLHKEPSNIEDPRYFVGCSIL